MAKVKTEGRHAGEFFLSEADGSLSRDNIKIPAGTGKIETGTVLGKITANGKFVPHNPGATDGSQTAKAIILHNVEVPDDEDLEVAAFTRNCEVKGVCLVLHESITTDAEKQAVFDALATNHIIVR